MPSSFIFIGTQLLSTYRKCIFRNFKNYTIWLKNIIIIWEVQNILQENHKVLPEVPDTMEVNNHDKSKYTR